jgi:hypothetical protein
LASGCEPSLRIIDFTESFCIPLPAIREIPGTPLTFASPELIFVQTGLLGREHITTGIDVWAFACMMYRLLGKGKFFISITGTADDVLADMIYLRFWREGGDARVDLAHILGGAERVEVV